MEVLKLVEANLERTKEIDAPEFSLNKSYVS